jgi:hypothetical protein
MRLIRSAGSVAARASSHLLMAAIKSTVVIEVEKVCRDEEDRDVFR